MAAYKSGIHAQAAPKKGTRYPEAASETESNTQKKRNEGMR